NMEASVRGEETMEDTLFRLKVGTLSEPGFLRCTVTLNHGGKKISEMVTLGFDVDNIKPTTELPKDFMKFWTKAIKAVRAIPLDMRMEKIASRSNDKVDVYEISFQNTTDSRMYGALAIPKKEGKYPVVLKVPGAGVRA